MKSNTTAMTNFSTKPLVAAVAMALLDAGYKMEQTGALRNMPVVPDKSKANLRLKGESAELHRAWYRGQVAKFFSFDEAPLAAAGGNVPLSPIYVTFTINPAVVTNASASATSAMTSKRLAARALPVSSRTSSSSASCSSAWRTRRERATGGAPRR